MQAGGCLLTMVKIIGSIAESNLHLGKAQIEPDLSSVLLAVNQL
jgi:hypothetical protein